MCMPVCRAPGSGEIKVWERDLSPARAQGHWLVDTGDCCPCSLCHQVGVWMWESTGYQSTGLGGSSLGSLGLTEAKDNRF